ncbi:MAG: hypothetical protein LBT47_11085 [Deltaproteobacteria bacterium]|nr:hypothetical protein [Deltaproteobacteria bacterium]
MVGALNEAMLKQFEKVFEHAPSNGDIILTDYRMAHLMREDKVERGAAITHGEAVNLGTMLAHPEAIMWDKGKKNFLYVFPSTVEKPKVK